MKPQLPRAAMAGLYRLSMVKVLGAVGMILLAEGLARGLAGLSSIGSGATATTIQAADVQLMAILVLTGSMLRSVSAWLAHVAAKRTALGEKERLRTELVEHWLHQGTPERSSPILASTGIDALDNFYTQYLPAMATVAVVPPVIISRIFFADWLSAVIVILTIPLIPVFMALIGWFTQDKLTASAESLQRVSAHIAELVSGLPVLVGLGRVPAQRRMLEELGHQQAKTVTASLRVAFLSALVLELLATLSVALVAVTLGIRLISGELSLEPALLVLLLVGECYFPFRELGAGYHASDDGREAYRRVQQVLKEPAEKPYPLTESDLPQEALLLQELQSRYRNRNQATFQAVSFGAPTGTLTVLTGPSGVGKTTVLGIISGAVTEEQAEIRGQLTVSSSHLSERDELAWLPQEIVTTEPTVTAELQLWGAADAIEAVQLLERCGLPATVHDQHPQSLSLGEQRRLSMAKICARVAAGAKLILLDEPTAHCDAEAAERVMSVIRSFQGKVTTVVSSHDPRLMEIADHVVPIQAVTAEASERAAVDPEDPLSKEEGSLSREEGFGGNAQGESLEDDSAALEGVADSKPPRAGIRYWWGVLQPRLATVLSAVLWGSLSSLAGLALLGLSAWLIIRASEQPPILYLLTAIVGVRFFGIVRAVARYLERLSTHKASLEMMVNLRSRLWDALAGAVLRRRELQRGDGVLARLVTDVDSFRDSLPRVVLPVISAALSSVGVLIAVALLSPQLLPLQAVILVVMVLAPLLSKYVDRRSSIEEQRLRRRLNERLSPILAAALPLRINRCAEQAAQEIRTLDQQALSERQRAAWAEGLGIGILTMASAVGAGAMLAVGAAEVISGQMGLEILAIMVFLQLGLLEVYTPVVTSMRHYSGLQELLGTLQENLVLHRRQALPAADPGYRIQAQELAVAWPGTDRAVAQGINCRLAPGDWLTVQGASGAGKSTFLATVMGFLPQASGNLYVQGRIAWCPQEPHLFNSSVRGNLALARPREDPPTEAQLHKVMADVGLGKWLRQSPQGLDSRIGVAGTEISGGQRQRLAVARALLTEAEIVLLDEPTAHLSVREAQELFQDLQHALADRTVIWVTHRESERSGTSLLL